MTSHKHLHIVIEDAMSLATESALSKAVWREGLATSLPSSIMAWKCCLASSSNLFKNFSIMSQSVKLYLASKTW